METTQKVAPEVVTEETHLSTPLTKHRFGGRRKIIFLLLVGIVIFGALGYQALQKKVKNGQATEAYTLVAEKISESAAISVRLPEDISFAAFDPQQSVHFSPEIKGVWQTTPVPPTDGVYKFLPEQKLPVGAYYLATLEAPEIRLEKMFSIDKDPTVLAIFPKQAAEVNEYSNITIMFSRPMVPLGVLDAMADVTPPVTITPPTEGRWKWITTRTLQFTPKTRLSRASNYRVEVQAGFTSLDGVATPAFVHQFTTRTLKYQYVGEYYGNANTSRLAHYQPMRIYFNQPIDLSRTTPLVTLKDQNGKDFPFVTSYGTRSAWNEKTKKSELLSDHAILEIYPDHDANGRKFLWDYNTTYTLTTSGAVPSEGDIALVESRTSSAHTEDLITGADRYLRPIPGIRLFHIGKMVTSPRAVVDQSYQVALNLTFDSQEAQDVYQVHPSHLEFVEKVFKPNCAKAVIYDFE